MHPRNASVLSLCALLVAAPATPAAPVAGCSGADAGTRIVYEIDSNLYPLYTSRIRRGDPPPSAEAAAGPERMELLVKGGKWKKTLSGTFWQEDPAAAAAIRQDLDEQMRMAREARRRGESWDAIQRRLDAARAGSGEGWRVVRMTRIVVATDRWSYLVEQVEDGGRVSRSGSLQRGAAPVPAPLALMYSGEPEMKFWLRQFGAFASERLGVSRVAGQECELQRPRAAPYVTLCETRIGGVPLFLSIEADVSSAPGGPPRAGAPLPRERRRAVKVETGLCVDDAEFDIPADVAFR